jgi:uncharacterized membrane protein YhaH (DUF805 family)
MTTEAPKPGPDQHRRFGIMQLGIALALAVVILTFVVWTQQLWMLFFLVLIVPNVYMGVRELRASRR